MPRRYGADGTRLWNGKTPEEFTEADAYRFMAETEAVLQRKELMDDPAQPAPASGKEEFYLSKKDDVLLTPEQIAAEERRWLFEAPIAELAEVKGVSIDEAVKMRTDAILQEAVVPITVSVRPIEPQGKLIGFASVNFGGVVIDDFKVVDGKNGIFLGAPSKPDPASRTGYRATVSLLCALHEGQWTIGEVQGTLQMLFDRQYILTEDVVVETRYRTETDTWTDEDGNSHTDIYQVPYDYYICTVTLENFDLSHVPVYVMGEDQLSRYAIYMATLGNRPDLFPDSPYVNKYITGKPGDYEVPGEYLDDETFAAMLAEAQKYIGYPYVWGGSSPATSFDCSGYVSWVINHSGWNVGRLGAQGLYNICTPTSSPKPGDLVFFKGTYDTPGVSHCGIYVGDGKMLHCGDPIGYTNLNTSYWQSHFYAYGRLP